jgi:response regulator RpfG family c-di-GMP phosphodiesterase
MTPTPLQVLIVEDSEADAELLMYELRRGGYAPTYRRVETAAAMQSSLAEQRWDLVVSDHSVAQFNSEAALDTLNASGLDIPFIIVSGTIGEEQAVRAMKAGASDYLVKGRLARLIPVVERELADSQTRQARRTAERTLRDREQQALLELAAAYETTLAGWARALDLRDRETEGHSQRVTDLTVQLARGIGISDAECVHIRRGALLHDIGKMGIPDNVLLKPSALTPDEWELMRRHPTYALKLLEPIEYLKPALAIPYCHHEKWDGTGYPRQLRGEEIPLAARIFAVADIWDAVRSDRPYRTAWPEQKALEYVESLSGTHLDPAVVAAFLRLRHSTESNSPAKSRGVARVNAEPKARILVVDDYQSNVELLKRWLLSDGFEVLTATSGEAALGVIAQHHPNLILLDVHIPEPNGIAVWQRLKADPATSNIPVIFLSALPAPYYTNERQFEPDQYLLKPVDAYELRTRVHHALEGHSTE